MPKISRLTELRELTVGDYDIKDQDLEHLHTLARLEILDLAFTGVTDQGFVGLHALPNLRTVRVYGYYISESAESDLKSQLPSLQVERIPSHP